MATRGPKPKPSNIRPFTGGKSKSATGAIEPPVEMPEPPSHLSPCEAAHFNRTAKFLAEMRVMTAADVDALTMYAESYEVLRLARKTISEVGLYEVSPKNGYHIQHPALGIANAAQDRCMKILAEFGLTPSARARLTGG